MDDQLPPEPGDAVRASGEPPAARDGPAGAPAPGEVLPPPAAADGGELLPAGTTAGTALPGSSTDIVAGLAPVLPRAPQQDGTLVERASLAIFWNAAFLPLKLGAKVVASIVVVRTLRGDGFQILTQLGALLTILGTLTDLGIERALPRFIPEFEMTGGRAGLSRLLGRVAAVKMLTMLPFVAALLIFPDLFLSRLQLHPQDARVLASLGRGQDNGPLLLGMVAGMLVLGAASDVSIQVLYAYFRQKTTNTLDVLNTLIPVLQAILVLPVLGLRVFGALLALLIGTAISVALSVRLMFRALGEERLGLRAPRRGGTPLPQTPLGPEAVGAASRRDSRVPRRPSNRSIWQRFTAYSAMMYLLNLSTTLYDQSFVVLLIGLIVADTARQRVEVVLVGLAFKFVRQLLQALVVPLTGVQTPLFSRLYAEDRLEGLRTAYSSLTRFLILFLFPAGVGLILMAQPLLVLLYVQPGTGPKADAVLIVDNLPQTVLACAILTVGLFGESLVSVALNVLMVYEDYRAVLIARSVALVSVPLLLLLEPPFGIVGVTVAVATAAIGSRLVALAFGVRRIGLAFPGAFLRKVVLATLPFALLIGPLAFLLPTAPVAWLSLAWFGRALVDGGLVLAAMLLFWLVFRRLGGIEPLDRQRFASLRVPGIKLLLRYL